MEEKKRQSIARATRHPFQWERLGELRSRIGLGVLLMLFLSFSPAGAQVRFGLKGGFQLATLDFNSDALKNTNRLGFSVGPMVKFQLPIIGLGVDVAALYDQRDLKVEDETFRQQSIVLQGDARYGAGIGDVLGIFLALGPQFSFNVGDDIIHWFSKDGELKQFSLQETMLSINMGVGVTFANHLEGTIRYTIPISKTADFTWQQLGQHIDDAWSHSKTRTNSWSISVAYLF